MFEILELKVFWITAVLTAIYVYLKYNVYNYWERHGVPHEAPLIPFGNVPISFFIGKISLGNLIKKNYEKFRQHPFHGFYILHKPVIMINDPEVIRIVLIKEFQRFCDRGWYCARVKSDPLMNNLFVQHKYQWERLRCKFSSIFTPGKLRQMYPLMTEVCDEMIKSCDAELKNTNDFNIKDIIARYTTDIISSVVYGLNCNSLKDPNSDFRRLSIRALEFGRINILVSIFLPEILESITIIPCAHKEVNDFFIKIFNDSVDYRRKENLLRKDFLNLLLQLVDEGKVDDDEKSSTSNKESKADHDRISMLEAAAQACLFFVAGFDTSSSTVTYCLLELAMNPEIQENLQQEIDEVSESSSGFTFDTIMEMQYLNMVFLETLRKYPPVPFLNRICVDDCFIPNSNYTIPKGMRVLISSSGIQYNPEYFPDPEKFDPSRFTKENFATRSTYVHLAFGEGPRNCVGKRFGILQSKLAIATMLRNYKFKISYHMNLPVLVKYITNSFVQSPEGRVYLRAEPRRK